ncbi:AAA family ATPase [Nonomuraea phyllanthi]|nr:AAA family ATPase [Nonomuraea phyllanthi]
MAAALLITGTVGVGKTSVADAAGDVLADEGVPNAVIDLDWLRRSWPSPPGDPFNGGLALRNLRAVAANFLASGAERLVLAGVIEDRGERARYEEALGVPLTVCRVRLPLAETRRRLRGRHVLDPEGLDWHLARAGELAAILDTAKVEDFSVDGTSAPRRVAEEAIGRWRP